MIRWAKRQADPEAAERMGVLAATGMIVGESLWGVAFAGLVYATNSDAPIALVGDSFERSRSAAARSCSWR